MNKKELAENLLNAVNGYSDLMENGLKQEHDIPDFSYLNTASEKTDTGVIEKTVTLNSDEVKNLKRKIIETAEKIIQCRECELHADSKKVPGIGSIASKIFVITAPVSPEEETNGFPLSGG